MAVLGGCELRGCLECLSGVGFRVCRVHRVYMTSGTRAFGLGFRVSSVGLFFWSLGG